MSKYIGFIFIAIMLCGCSNTKFQEENNLLKNKVIELEIEMNQLKDEIDLLSTKLNEYEQAYTLDTSITYHPLDFKQVFIDRESSVYITTSDSSLLIYNLFQKSVVDVLYGAKIKDEEWYLIQFPIFEAGPNQGWIKANDTMEYTTDLIKDVLLPVSINDNALGYEVSESSDIVNTEGIKPQFTTNLMIVRKENGYVLLDAGAGYTIWVKDDQIIYPKIK